MNSLYLFAAALAGALLPLQAGLNAGLARVTGSGVWAALFSFMVGTLALLLLTVAGRQALAGSQQLINAPWWMWMGGILGALYVYALIITAPQLGAATVIGVTIAGQLLASLLIDHFGWVGFASQAISWQRCLGAALLIVGVILIKRY